MIARGHTLLMYQDNVTNVHFLLVSVCLHALNIQERRAHSSTFDLLLHTIFPLLPGTYEIRL